jgi:queuine tRNA-ribosyltransferase
LLFHNTFWHHVTAFEFSIDATVGSARAGEFCTPHGPVQTPAFMPVGTQATVKTLDPNDLRELGAKMILGDELIRDFGGLHEFMGWDGPILTDSGGFQVFSLEGLRTISENGVEFRSHLDGSTHIFTPETVMAIERNLGADVIMQFDHVIPGQSDGPTARDAMERSLRWLERCAVEFTRLEAGERQALFPIVQGGIHEALRIEASRGVRERGDWVGYGIGGLSVGEAKPDMYRILDVVDGELPHDRPRYLMGVGFPEDLVEGVLRGVDLFDCVAPTRMGRNGAVFTSDGRLNIKRAEFRTDKRPLDESCTCSACRRFSRAYLRHLYTSDETLGLRLLSLHNVHFLVSLMRDARAAIQDGTIGAWSQKWLARYHSRPVPSE